MPRKYSCSIIGFKMPALCMLAIFTAAPASAQSYSQAAQQAQIAQQMMQMQAQQQAIQGNNQAQQNAFDSLAGTTPAPGLPLTYNNATGLPSGAPPTNAGTPRPRQILAENLEEEIIETDTVPPDLRSMQTLERENEVIDEKGSGMPIDIRRDALREAAISFGARGGLAWRTYFIRKELEKRATALDKVYDFRQLLIPAPSGFLIEPPIINESINAMLIETNGQQAAVSDRMYNIVNNAKIVSAPRTWRTYLEREWGEVSPPPDILRPENEEERKLWVELVREGWDEGVLQANEIFQDDLNSLMADFQGMIRYRMLLSQNMISPPYALQVDRGVTGDGKEMRIGDRAVQITGAPELITGSDQWQPASR